MEKAEEKNAPAEGAQGAAEGPLYGVEIEVRRAEPGRVRAIRDAVQRVAPMSVYDFPPRGLEGRGSVRLAAGTPNGDSVAQQIAAAVHEANGRPCPVVVRTQLLDPHPVVVHRFGGARAARAGK